MGVIRIFIEGVKSVDNKKNTKGVGIFQHFIDTKIRKRGEQTGLDTLVVHALNNGCLCIVIPLRYYSTHS